MSINKEWFTKKYWNDEIEAEFYKRLKRSRHPFSKAQYMRIQAAILLRNTDDVQRLKGVELMKKMLDEFPEDEMNYREGLLYLGEYYRSIRKYEKALNCFEIVYQQNKNDNMCKIGVPEMHIAKTIIEAGNADMYEYARKVMDEVNYRTLFVEELKNKYNEIMAELSNL